MLKDLRHGVRVLLHAKGWTAVVVISLALGIGANAALFSGVNDLLLKTVPVKDSDALVRLRYAGKNDMATDSSDYGPSNPDPNGQSMRATFSYPMYQQFLVDNRTMSDLFAAAPLGRVNVVADGKADLASGVITSGNYYRVLGVSASLGRTLTPEDDRPAAPPAAVISARYWRSRFSNDPNVLGKAVTINNVPVTIVGVLPPEFTGVQEATDNAPDLGVPLSLDRQLNPGPPRLSQPTYWWLQLMGRLKPGVTAAQVQANLETVFQHTARAGLDVYMGGLDPAARSRSRNRDRHAIPQLRVDSGSHGIYDVDPSDLRAKAILSVVVALVLLIVCANVANLLLSRAAMRQKEISVRLSMGATRGRLIRQLLTESLLLACIGGALGIIAAYWARRLPGLSIQASSMDWHVVAFVCGVTGLTGMAFGIAPALRATRINVNTALKETGRGVAGSRSTLGKLLLVAQVAISLVLLIGAGLFLRTVQNLRSVNVGFNPQNLVLFRINPQLNGYDDPRATLLFAQMTDRLRTVPGVRSVALSQPALLSGNLSSTSIFIRGRVYTQGQKDENINRLVVSPNFFDVMEMPVVRGRGLTPRDDAGAPKVALINDAAVRTYFPGQNPLGQRFGSSEEDSGQIEIVGVVRDAKYNSVREPAPPTLYVPYLQGRMRSPTFEVRTAADPLSAVGGIRETVRQIDPNLPLMNVSTQSERVEERLSQEKLFAQAYAIFGGLAVVLASIGLFGLMSYSVARRTSEIGVRMALGAQRRDVLRMVLVESMTLVVAGIGIGLVTALAAGRLVASLLFGLAATDALTLLLAMLVMVLVSAVAGFLPALRAVRVDPMVALRYE